MTGDELRWLLQSHTDGLASTLRALLAGRHRGADGGGVGQKQDGLAHALFAPTPPRVRLMLVGVIGDDVGKGYCVGSHGLTDADALVMLGEAMGEILARDPNAAKLLARLQAEPEHLQQAIEELRNKKEPKP